MLELILKLYKTSMAGQVRTPVPHLFGPPGCGKSTFVEQAAKLLNVDLHVINVSRVSPLELEGVQMPDKEHAALNFLTARYWTRMKDGDILLLDEFLRGFPEVYNGLLDILTSRRIGGFQLPEVFIIAASNSTVAYDKALEDRLLHLPVPDLRTSKQEYKHIAKVITEAIGLHPEMATSHEMTELIDTQIKPTYQILDQLGNQKKAVGAATYGGCSVRHLIGQARLRHVTCTELKDLIFMSNTRAVVTNKFQYVVLLDGRFVSDTYRRVAWQLRGNPKLTPIQRINLELNLELIELEDARKLSTKTKEEEDDPFI